jgi:hypothetical protein
MRNTLTEDQKARLRQAHNIIADVQFELAIAEDRQELKPEEETWRHLYWVRVKLIEFMHRGNVPRTNGAARTRQNYVEV